jgi:hypothetical protein
VFQQEAFLPRLLLGFVMVSFVEVEKLAIKPAYLRVLGSSFDSGDHPLSQFWPYVFTAIKAACEIDLL